MALVTARKPPPALCGLLLLSTAGRPVGDLMIEQLRAQPGNAAILPEVESLVADLAAGKPRDPAMISEGLRPLFSTGLQRYMMDLFAYDPVVEAGHWPGPALIVQGDADVQVLPRDANLLQQAMPQAKRVNLPGGTHMLKAGMPNAPLATYTDPTLPLHPALVPALVDFMDAHPPKAR